MNGSVTVMPAVGAEGVTIVQLDGEFDMGNIGELSLKADDAIRAGDGRVVVDLAAVRFLDSSMLKALVGLQQRVRAAGGAVVLVRPAPVVWRVFEVTLLDRFFRSVASGPDALEELAEAPLGVGQHSGSR